MKERIIKPIITLIVIFSFSYQLKAQWLGSTNENNKLYRIGNVGIGFSNPAYSLDIKAILANQTLFRLSHPTAPTGAGFMIGFNTDGVTDNNIVSLGVEYSYTDYDVINIKRSTRFVGIGTTNPYSKLTVQGTLSSITDYGFAAFQDSDAKGLSIGYDDATMCTWLYSRDVGVASRGLHFSANKFIFSGGNVGIGTTTTGSHKLAVDGSIGAREVIVETTTWSDFVFADNYQLKSLSEVESFIKENKHLPDVPSEKEVKEKGIDLGKMDATLLQKIEELTLYVIQQNKKIEKQQKQINSLIKNQNK